jgi:N-acyl-phosphatidylethanolamine-hydrolysing phospholipase D
MKPSRPPHHSPNGGFRNPWASAETHGFADFLKWTLVDRRRNPRRPDPDPRSFPLVRPDFVFPRAAPDCLTITWVGHTSFLLQIGGVNALLDPIWAARASPVSFAGPRRLVPPAVNFDELPPIDLVCLSHDHYDHLDAATVTSLTDRYPAIVWYTPLGVGDFVRARGASDVRECDWMEASEALGLGIACVPAQHFSGRSLGRRNHTLWCGWTIRSTTHSILFAGDTALHPVFRDIGARFGPFDIAILPIGAYEPRWFMGSVHMNPEDALVAYTELQAPQQHRPLRVIASHWGTFKLTDEPLDEPPQRMRAHWANAGCDGEHLWILSHGETRSLGTD